MSEELTQISLKEVEEHDSSDSLWIVIDDKIYDLTDFAAEHPGGSHVLEENAGREATQEFEDAGHSDDARAMMKDFLIGQLAEEDRERARTQRTHSEPQQGTNWLNLKPWAYFLIPIGAVVVTSIIVRYAWRGSAK